MEQESRKLLTDRLKQRVEDKLLDCIKLAAAEYPEHTWFLPEVRYDVKNSVGGLAYGGAWLIRLNLILCYENEDRFVDTTVPHEFAHLMVRKVFGLVKTVEEAGGKLTTKRIRSHGKEWKHMMAILGVKANVYHTYGLESIPSSRKRKRGSLVVAEDQVAIMLKRLENGVKRLTPDVKLKFAAWLDQHIETLPENEK